MFKYFFFVSALIGLLGLLIQEGLIVGWSCLGVETKATILVYLKYSVQGNSVFQSCKIISRPGRRIYVSNTRLLQAYIFYGNSTFVLQASHGGFITGREAISRKIGGELLCIFRSK